ncbi:MAG TPA: hypothetical protein VGK55_09685 [Actinomycetes bacterium]|jgi:hypothetical protein
MSSGAIRDPLADQLLTPQHAALILIDDQPAVCMAFAALDALREGYQVYPGSTRSPARLSKRITPAWSVSFKPEAGRSVGSRSRASCSATGLDRRRCRKSFRSC